MYDIYAKLRDKIGLTDYAVAKAISIGRSTLSDWKTGKHTPNRDNLQKIADYFNVSMEYLMTGKETATMVQPMAYSITPSEYEIIKAYRNLSEDAQDMVLNALKLERPEEVREKKQA